MTSVRHQIAVHESWARTVDRSARTQPARDALRAKFEAEVDPAGVMDPATKAKAVESAIKAHYRRLALKSAAARQRKAS
jgi:hypothetical protein